MLAHRRLTPLALCLCLTVHSLSNQDLLDELTETLIKEETVDFRDLYKMVGKKHPELAKAQMDKQVAMTS